MSYMLLFLQAKPALYFCQLAGWVGVKIPPDFMQEAPWAGYQYIVMLTEINNHLYMWAISCSRIN